MNKLTSTPIIYREYNFDDDFPFLLMESSCAAYQKTDFIHFHNSIEIAYLEKGTMKWNLENEEEIISSGDACFLPPYFSHSSLFIPQSDVNGVHCYFIYFNPEQLLSSLYPYGFPEELSWYRYSKFKKHLTSDVFENEIHTIQTMIQVYEKKATGYQAAIIGLVDYLLIQLYRSYQDQALFSPLIRDTYLLTPAITYLNQEYPSDISPAYLAQLCGMTNVQFTKNIKQCFQQTPIQYINTLRIHKACELLCSTEEKIINIALKTGFNSLPSFNRTFHKVIGQSPTAFRNEHCVISKKSIKHIPYVDES